MAETPRSEEIGLHNLKPKPGSKRPRKRIGRGEGRWPWKIERSVRHTPVATISSLTSPARGAGSSRSSSPWRIVSGSQPSSPETCSTPPWPSLAASTGTTAPG